MADAFLPERVPIDAYGGGGFRFRDMSHRGSLTILASGVRDWAHGPVESLTAVDVAPILADCEGLEFVLLGTGLTQIFPSRDVRQLFDDAGLGLEVMATGAAARTFNVLLAEQRAVGAALVAVP